MIDARLCRSWLFVPGDSERKQQRCWDSGADAVILDLEDSVAPQNKVAARATVRRAVEQAKAAGRRTAVYVRVNSIGTGLAEDDMRETMEARPDGYMIPKVSQRDHVTRLAKVLEEGGAPDEIGLIPIVTETPDPVFRLPELCASHPRNVAILWGTEDLSAAMGARRVKRPDGTMLDVFRTVRSLSLLAGTAAGLGVIDTPVIELGDMEVLERESLEAAWMGFTGKLAIHPAQVPVINKAFMPTAEELERSLRVVDAAAASDGSVITVDGRMIEAQHVRIARHMLALAEAFGRDSSEPAT